jgi:hypothetical protein
VAKLRELIETAQFGIPPPTRVSRVAAVFGLKSPISLLRVAALLKPETVDWNTGPISSGDDKLVTANLHLRLKSTGGWNLKGTVEDGGDGAGFALMMGPKHVDEQGAGWFVIEADKLDDDQLLSINKSGRELWIARNWDAIRTKGFQWEIHAKTSTSVGAVIGVVVAVVVSAGLATLFISSGKQCAEQGGWTTETDVNGSTRAICRFK